MCLRVKQFCWSVCQAKLEWLWCQRRIKDPKGQKVVCFAKISLFMINILYQFAVFQDWWHTNNLFCGIFTNLVHDLIRQKQDSIVMICNVGKISIRFDWSFKLEWFLQTDGYRSLDRYLQLYNGTLAYGFMDDKLDRVMQYGTIWYMLPPVYLWQLVIANVYIFIYIKYTI